MTTQGHAYTRFQRALKTRSPYLAMEAARELRKLGLADALSLCLLLRDGDPLRYESAAVRWLARLLANDSTVSLREVGELAELLVGVGGHQQVAVIRLERWLRSHGFAGEADRLAEAA